MRTKLTLCLTLAFFPIMMLTQCPENTKTLHRIGKTRYYIIQNTKQRGNFVTIEQARQDCSKHGLKLATVKNLLSLAVVGRPLEKMVFEERLKDTWYWLDAKYDMKSEKYHWGNDEKDELKYTMILYRNPRPIGVSSHITYNGVYQKNQDKPQCLTLALPWLGSADHYKNTTVFFGHETAFDERDCKSQQKRHAMCEASKKDCQVAESNPFVLDEDKHEYFDEGNWIFGDRKYIVNWKQQTFNESERYCNSLGLQLMNAGELEKYLIPHVKMWSREVTVSLFWTGMSYNGKTKQYIDSSGNIIEDESISNNFTESEFQSRSSKNSAVFCVALSIASEFQSQMPCSNPSSLGCQWSLFRYVPANCNNYHGTICQHEDYDERDVKWYPNFKTNLDDVLEKTALTTTFGYKGNSYVLRSKYKQTFGLCYCPKGYRMIRSHSNANLVWTAKPMNTTGKEIFEYDYLESYWMVSTELYSKYINSSCTISYTENGTRKFKEVKCTDWHFYLCERLGRRPTKPFGITINKAPPMKWKEGPQPRFYPLESNDPCECKLKYPSKEFNTVTNQCVLASNVLAGCSAMEFSADHFCQRSGEHIFYAISGIVCNSKTENDFCKIERTMYAVNFNGNPHNDSRGINHSKVKKTDWEVQRLVWVEYKSRRNVKNVPQADVVLYNGLVSGEWRKINQSRSAAVGCAVLLFETDGDGMYEISMKTGELWFTASEKQNRTFSVLLNDIYIVKEFVLERYRTSPLGLELVANFRILENSKLLLLQGHPSKAISRDDKKLQLEFCHSTCDNKKLGFWVDHNWIMYGLSIVKFAA